VGLSRVDPRRLKAARLDNRDDDCGSSADRPTDHRQHATVHRLRAGRRGGV